MEDDVHMKEEAPDEYAEMYNPARVNIPLKKVEEKWKLVPAFLRLRGLVK